MNYIKQRLLGTDTRFAEDRTYLMFLFLVKEAIALKQSRVTFFRKARLHYRGNNQFLKEAQRDEIERHDVGYKAFKQMRGTPPYFADKKQNVMAMLRQLGPPHIFLTLSAAEVIDQYFILQYNIIMFIFVNFRFDGMSCTSASCILTREGLLAKMKSQA